MVTEQPALLYSYSKQYCISSGEKMVTQITSCLILHII